MMGKVVLGVVAILAMVQLMAEPGNAVILSCEQVEIPLTRCVNYLTYGGHPPRECCAGVVALREMIDTGTDKRVACSCLKAAANSYSNFNQEAARALPAKCGVRMDVPIDRHVNCNAIR